MGGVLAYACGRRAEKGVRKFPTLLKPFGVVHSDTDTAAVYERPLPASAHPGGNFHTQQIEGPPLSLRTRIKRLTRNPLCVLKAVLRPDTVIGLFGNRYAFGTPL